MKYQDNMNKNNELCQKYEIIMFDEISRQYEYK